MRTIGAVTVGRSDYGIWRPILRRIQQEPELRLQLIVSGAHLLPEFGSTVKEIEADGFPIGARVEMLLSGDAPETIAASIGCGVDGFARSFVSQRPDLLVIVGDRFEMFAAAVAALPLTIPVAHIHGGELTQGVIDDAMRHSMTKLSHLHFVSTEVSAERVKQLGEEPWRVTVCGAPSLDQLATIRLLTKPELEARLGISLDPPPLLVTFHPVTLEYEQAQWQVQELVEALRQFNRPVVVTAPNEDTHGRLVRQVLEAFVAAQPTAKFVEALGNQAYFSLMAVAGAVVGNSSSGLIEAPSFGLPVVNIGSRQDGRLRADNVIDTGYQKEEIREAIATVLSPAFRHRLRHLKNPYGDGRASERIVARLRDVPLDRCLLHKRFVDLPSVTKNDRFVGGIHAGSESEGTCVR